MCFSVDAQTRDPKTEVRDTLLSQMQMEAGTGAFSEIGPRIDIEREYRPQYAQLDLDIMRQTLTGDDGLLALMRDEVAPASAAIESETLARRREDDIADVKRLAGDSREAFEGLNPEGARLLKLLSQQATTELEAGRGLTENEERQYQQAARQASAARGLGFGNADVFNEALTTGRAGNQRLRERQGMAMQAMGATQNFYGDPFLAILGRGSGANPNAMVGQAAGFNPGTIADPYNPFYERAYDYNANARQHAHSSSVNNRNAFARSAMESTAAVIGAAAGACWVAREVFGPTNPAWLAFRRWLLTTAPTALRDLYLAQGEALAQWLRQNPGAKGRIKAFMEHKIATYTH